MTGSQSPTIPQRHDEISDQFLVHAREELASGDLLQAAEKAWGAISHCVNAVVKREGWPTGTHRKTLNNALRLIDSDAHLADHRKLQLQAVQSLHRNFCEELMTEDEVRFGISQAADLVASLRRLADAIEHDWAAADWIPE